MRKRILSLVLALAMVMSLCAAALADSLDEDHADGEQTMQAKRGVDDTFSATVTWGEMNFVWYDSTQTWEVEGDNSVTVKNTSERNKITAELSYTPGDNGEKTVSVFTDKTNTWTVGKSGGEAIGGNDAYTAAIAKGKETKVYLMFTTADRVSKLADSEYLDVGRLSISIGISED